MRILVGIKNRSLKWDFGLYLFEISNRRLKGIKMEWRIGNWWLWMYWVFYYYLLVCIKYRVEYWGFKNEKYDFWFKEVYCLGNRFVIRDLFYKYVINVMIEVSISYFESFE